MKKAFTALLGLVSISSFAQVTPIVGNLIENMENRGTGVMTSLSAQVKGNYSDEGETVVLSNLYLEYKDGSKYGLRRKHSKEICQSLGFAERIKGSTQYKRKNLFVVKSGGFIQRGPNRVLDSIECLKY